MPSKIYTVPFLILKVRYPAIKNGFFYYGVVIVMNSNASPCVMIVSVLLGHASNKYTDTTFALTAEAKHMASCLSRQKKKIL